MHFPIDETHDPSLESWVESANAPDAEFPIQNLPLGLAALPLDEDDEVWLEQVVVPIGHLLLNISGCVQTGLLGRDGPYAEDFHTYIGEAGRLNALGDPDVTPGFRAELRRAVSALLRKDNPLLRDNTELRELLFLNPNAVALIPPMDTYDYTDFYASVFHATNVGSMFRPDNPLLPNYKWLPVGYHGRASSIVLSGAEIRRPMGQQTPTDDSSPPSFGPSRMLDYELELGIVMGSGNPLGDPIDLDDAESHVLGICLLNDWSARDIQKWEYQPLGPFLAKNFATTISPFIVTMEALAPFRCPAMKRSPADPRPLAHLDSPHNRDHGGLDITLEVFIATAAMREKGLAPARLSRGTFRDMYWTIAQLVTHHASNGCNLQPGDILGSGTISGPTRESRGCMLELTWDGDPFATPPKVVPGTQRTPITLPTGEKRTFLQDGDEVILKGYCERSGFRRISLGEARGIILPSHAV